MRRHHTQLRPPPRTNSMDYRTVQVIRQNLTNPQSYTLAYTHSPDFHHMYTTVTRYCVRVYTHTCLPIGCKTTQLKRKVTGKKDRNRTLTCDLLSITVLHSIYGCCGNSQAIPHHYVCSHPFHVEQ